MEGVEWSSVRVGLQIENRAQVMVFYAVIFPYLFPLRPKLHGFATGEELPPANGYVACVVPELHGSNAGTHTEDSSVPGCDAVSHLTLTVIAVSFSKISVSIDQPKQRRIQEG